jgi:pimeloyl-ACP methyl ester carboxylesterase
MHISNGIYRGSLGRESLFDLEIPDNWNGTLVIFVHGFMGFKDWGAWSLVQDYFTSHNFGFAKFNLSHNGGTTHNGIDFPDELAFAQNTYSKEIKDISLFREHIQTLIQPRQTYLIGHSRGGGDVILHAQKTQVDKIALWASISDIGSRFPEGTELAEWKNSGVRTITNSRTKQALPQHYSLYADFKLHEERLNIEHAIKLNTRPIAVIHGSNDTSVPLAEGQALAQWSGTELVTIEGADHVFGAKHPWEESSLPSPLLVACEATLAFFNQ